MDGRVCHGTDRPARRDPAETGEARNVQKTGRGMKDATIRWIAWDLEGGDRLTDHPTDAGGMTRYGLTAPYLAELPADLAVPRDPALLSEADAIRAYGWLWDRLRCEAMPWQVATVVYDGAVQHGRGMMAKMLQGQVGAKPDGAIGPLTLAAVARAAQDHPRGPLGLAEDLIWRRLRTYAVLGQTRRTTGLPNLPGWINRMSLVRSRLIPDAPRTG
jgi:lysozyme family protein